jgi:hypothetical protein
MTGSAFQADILQAANKRLPRRASGFCASEFFGCQTEQNRKLEVGTAGQFILRYHSHCLSPLL